METSAWMLATVPEKPETSAAAAAEPPAGMSTGEPA